MHKWKAICWAHDEANFSKVIHFSFGCCIVVEFSLQSLDSSLNPLHNENPSISDAMLDFIAKLPGKSFMEIIV